MNAEAALESIRLAPAREFAARTARVLGIPVRFEADAAGVLAAVDDAFGCGIVGGADGSAEVRVRIHLHPGSEGSAGGVPVAHAVPRRELLVVTAPASRGYADARRREAVAAVTRDLVRDSLQFRREVLEALTLFIVTRMDRAPLHAAAVVRDGAALLIAGPSGAGKSTTCYAAVRSGLRLLSEDTVFLQDDPFAVWGRPARLHLTPDAVRFFPELAQTEPEWMPNGKLKCVVDLHAESIETAQVAHRAGICLLRRGGEAGIEPIDPDAAVDALTRELDAGFDAFADTIGERIRRVARGGAWWMALPSHPCETVPLLHRMFDAMEIEAPPSRVLSR
jgi:hypothetical protein